MNTFFDILLSPPLAFVVFLLLFYLLYLLAGRLAPKVKKSGGKLATYACGEDIPGYKIQFGYRLFFFVALFFTMMHVATLVVATLPSGPLVFLGVFYLGMIFLSVLALITKDE
jgi:NADH-quinone oxidoreductase subunit A